MNNWKLDEDAFILDCINESTCVADGIDRAAYVLNRTENAIRSRYYNHLRKARISRKKRNTCLVFDKTQVDKVQERYNEDNDVTIIILHIKGRKSV